MAVANKDDYLQALLGLFPVGPAWPRDADAPLAKLLTGLAVEFSRLDERADELVDEADPRTTAELLSDWERNAGLPDSCMVSATYQSSATRRAALVGRLSKIGEQSPAYFIALAASIGYTVTLTEFKQFKAGQAHSGDAVATNWQFAWQVNAPLNSITPFRAGLATAGDPLNSWGNKLLECVLSRFKPAHTIVIFAYQ